MEVDTLIVKGVDFDCGIDVLVERDVVMGDVVVCE